MEALAMEALALEGLRMIPEELRESEGGKEESKPVAKRARRLLYRRMKVEVQDGRVFVGTFHCLDKQGNIILYDTVEFRNVGVAPTEQRSLGLVLVPARWRTSCHVECSLDEKMDLLSLDQRS